MGQSLPQPALRPFLPEDAPLLLAILTASIEELAADDYSEPQREAWIAAAAEDEETFAERLASQLTLIGMLAGSPVGFISLKGNDHIDLLFVHPAAAGQGVATTLCDAAEKLAAARGAARLTVDASDSARDFFIRRGFTPERRNMVPLGDEWLGNTAMQKPLAAAAGHVPPQ